MYFLYELERVITLHPSFFGPRVKEYLTSRLLDDVEGTCTGQYYIICVMDTYDISEGRVVPGSAIAEYTVHYRAVVWRPFKGETVRPLRGVDAEDNRLKMVTSRSTLSSVLLIVWVFLQTWVPCQSLCPTMYVH